MALGSAEQWWRRALVAGATTAVVITVAGCGASQAPDAASTGSASTGGGACKALPDSQVPPLEKALTETDAGTYCATLGTTILVVLQATDFDATHRWEEPSVTGPDGGVHQVSVPLTALRGTTVAGFQVTAPGSYRFTSTTGAHQRWAAVVEVRPGA